MQNSGISCRESEDARRCEIRRVGKAKRAHHSLLRRGQTVGTAQARLCPTYEIRKPVN